jgi:SAM-dependent methyltransferase
MAPFNNLYQRAIYYDIVFNRDVTQEVDFIIQVYRQHVGDDLLSLLDLACGPAYHARNFARRGCRAVGLDLREEMLAFAESLAAQDGVKVEWIAADMRTLKLDTPVDVTINVFDGIDCLQTNADLLAHFKAIAENLTPNGLYLIDVTHPRETSLSEYKPFEYHGERDGVKVDIYWATNNPFVDPLTHVAHTELEIHVDDHGEKTVIHDTSDERVVTAQEITLLAELSGVFKPVGWYGAYDVNQPFDNSPEAHRMIAILQKTS